MFRRLHREERGFTLIELLIVIVILGILAAIVVFAVGGITDRGVESACKSDLKNVEVAAEAYRANEGAYPAGTTSVDRIEVLEDDEYIRDAPSSLEYTITLNADGTVGGDLAGGTATANCSD